MALVLLAGPLLRATSGPPLRATRGPRTLGWVGRSHIRGCWDAVWDAHCDFAGQKSLALAQIYMQSKNEYSSYDYEVSDSFSSVFQKLLSRSMRGRLDRAVEACK